MRRLITTLAVVLAFSLPASDLAAQETKILSPRDSVFLSLDTNTISVNYGRPSMRGRKIMGELVPWNKVWRTGANQATHLRTTFDMVLGGVPVTRGTYTLWTIPSPTGWKIVLNKQTGQWGTVYNERLDLARFDAVVKGLPAPVETLTIALESTGKSSGVLRLSWERTSISVPFEKNNHIRPISPLDSSSIMLKGKSLSIQYSRPYARGRAIWGVVVPYDSVWRTGANLSTTFKTDIALKIDTISLPKGVYSLYSIPTEKGFTLIVNKQAGGPPQYDPALDLARIPMTLKPGSRPVDPFRIWFKPRDAHSVFLEIGWANRTYEVVLSAKP
jgi:hypothetical protein